MSRMLSPSGGKPYGLARVCRIWRSARASVYRHRHPEPARQSPRPAGPMPDAALLERIRDVLSGSPFHGEGHRKVWARLGISGVRTSLRRVLRLMRENDLLAPGRVAVFVAIDHCNAECIGIHAARRGTRFEALEPLRQGVRRHFGAIGKDVAGGLSVRHDHGSQYMSDTFMNTAATA